MTVGLIAGGLLAIPGQANAAEGPYWFANWHASMIRDRVVLDVENQGTHDGAAVHLWDWCGGGNQLWYMDRVGTSTYKLRNLNSGKCMDIEGPSTWDGVKVHQWDCYNSTSQHWKQEQAGTRCHHNGTICETVYRFRNVLANKCLDAAGAGSDLGTRVQIWTCHGGDNQLWY